MANFLAGMIVGLIATIIWFLYGQRGVEMKIETTALKAKILLTFLKDPAIKRIAISHYAHESLDQLIAALERVVENPK